MASNIRSSSPTQTVYFLDTSIPAEQVLAVQTLPVTAGTTAVTTLDLGNPLVISRVFVRVISAVTGAETVQVSVTPPGGSATNVTAASTLSSISTVNGVTIIDATASTAICAVGGSTISITQAVGTAGTIQVTILAVPLPQ